MSRKKKSPKGLSQGCIKRLQTLDALANVREMSSPWHRLIKPSII